MQTQHKRLYSALQRVQGFLDQHGAQLGTINTSGARAQLDDAVTQLTVSAGQQDPTRFVQQEQQQTVRRLRDAVRINWMKPIAKVGGTLPKTVEFRSLRLPPAGIDIAGFIIAARAMASVANAHASTFTGAGLPSDFVAQFTAATDALAAAVASKDRTKGTRVSATASLKAAASEGRAAVRIINALIEPVVSLDPGLSADWETTKQVLTRALPIAPATPTTPVAGTTAAPAVKTAPPATSTSTPATVTSTPPAVVTATPPAAVIPTPTAAVAPTPPAPVTLTPSAAAVEPPKAE